MSIDLCIFLSTPIPEIPHLFHKYQQQFWPYGFCLKNISWAMFMIAILENKSNNYSAITIFILHRGLIVDDLITEGWWQECS